MKMTRADYDYRDRRIVAYRYANGGHDKHDIAMRYGSNRRPYCLGGPVWKMTPERVRQILAKYEEQTDPSDPYFWKTTEINGLEAEWHQRRVLLQCCD